MVTPGALAELDALGRGVPPLLLAAVLPPLSRRTGGIGGRLVRMIKAISGEEPSAVVFIAGFIEME